MDEDDFESGEDDKLFEELDKTVGLAKKYVAGSRDTYSKYYTDFRMVELMAEEVNASDIKEYKQIGGSWVVEIIYQGIIFITVTGSRPFSELI